MSPEKEFDAQIAAIYGLGKSDLEWQHAMDAPLDMRQAEFRAMADAFLGKDYDREKRHKVESCQTLLREQQALLYRRYEEQQLTPEQYVDAYNALLADTFAQCENVLGKKDFLKLFGADPVEAGGFIDKDTFVAAQQTRPVPSSAKY